jgi:hypothetical protein
VNYDSVGRDLFNTNTDARQENGMLDDNEMQENFEFLFNESNERSIIEDVDETLLSNEVPLPSKNTSDRISEASEVKLEINIL